MKTLLAICIALLFLPGLVAAQSEKHVNVAGTAVWIIPPAGFSPASRFAGFQDTSSHAHIMVTEMSPGPYEEVSKGMTKEGLAKAGMTLIDSSPRQVGNAPGVLLKVSQQANGYSVSKYILVTGDARKTVMVNGIIPDFSADQETSVKEAVLSTVWLEKVITDPEEAAPFSISTSGTKMKYASSMSNNLIYTVNGDFPPKDKTLTSYFAGNSFAAQTIGNQKEYAINRLKKFPYTNVKIISTKEITIDGLRGWEIVANGNTEKHGDLNLMYEVMLFEGNNYYLLTGFSYSEFETNTRLFRQLTNTFKRKQK